MGSAVNSGLGRIISLAVNYFDLHGKWTPARRGQSEGHHGSRRPVVSRIETAAFFSFQECIFSGAEQKRGGIDNDV
ncbi:hypothetical protein CBW46_011825 [Paenibacillus xerothermodurans]|uniref:Uncharacterized protein n=1 Tax=Paenibacillus xerothermodurans TaxID=1977292 RepID=A0A2W1NA85_PAEXE|nr:hypothetical protein CBW46_011825 [Paenibacillus xerothermodurans]